MLQKDADFQNVFEHEALSMQEIAAKTDKTKKIFLSYLDEDLTDAHGDGSERMTVLKNRLAALCDHVLPYYSKADLLAAHYQRIYRFSSKAVYIMAAMAVFIVSAQHIFHSYIPETIIFGEIAFMVIILAISFYGNWRGWHRRWLDYRLLAERLRTGLMATFITGGSTWTISDDLHGSSLRGSWCLDFADRVLASERNVDPMSVSRLECRIRFIERAWLDDQLEFHRTKSESEQRKHEILSHLGEVFYGLTIIIAFFHIFHVGHSFAGSFAGQIWTFLAIAFPVVGFTFGALKAHFEFRKIAEHSKNMATLIESIKRQLSLIKDADGLYSVVYMAERLMFQENAEWYSLIVQHKIEPPA